MWSVFGEKARGYSHALKNRSCQDAFEIRSGNGYVIAAVADGHGSASCPFSEEGAKLAVTLCADIMEETLKGCFANDSSSGSNPSEDDLTKPNLSFAKFSQENFLIMKQNMDFYIPKKIDYIWKAKIKELHEAKLRNDAENLYLLYGTTLLCLVATDNFFCALQLGDGDILSVADNGDTSWLISPKDLAGSETDSLCQNDSWSNMRVYFSRWFSTQNSKPLDSTTDDSNIYLPRMFLLATDGYSNSYADSSDFLQIGRDYLTEMREKGLDYIVKGISGWISETSEGGSGDDITLVIIVRDV